MLRKFAFAVALPLALCAAPAVAQEETEVIVIADQRIDLTDAISVTLVDVETTVGTFRVALETQRAPVTAANFLRYADQDRFDGTVFYRSLQLDWGEQPNGLIQAGTRSNPDRVLDPIAHEPTSQTGLSHGAGTLTMARYDPGSATGDFVIMLQRFGGMDADPDDEDPSRQAGFAAFGQVVAGMEVVHAIHALPIATEITEGSIPGQMIADPVEIIDVRRVESAPPE